MSDKTEMKPEKAGKRKPFLDTERFQTGTGRFSENDERRKNSDCFKKLYRAHETIADISNRVKALYASVTSISPVIDGMPKSQNPKRFENTMFEILHLKERAEELLKRRVEFDVFISDLSSFHRDLLCFRFDKCLTWRQIAAELSISRDSVKRHFNLICDKADETGLFADERELLDWEQN